MRVYSLTFRNMSQQEASFLCFQADPGIGVPGVVSLAWWAEPAYPDTQVDFEWNTDYVMGWSETGDLKPGVHVAISGSLAADPSGESGPNLVELDYQDGGFTLVRPSNTGSPGSLTINTGSGFSAGAVSVAIGMSGAATFAVSVMPEDRVTFTPHPEYWVAFGDFIRGDVLDGSRISNSVRVDFPPNVYAMTVIYEVGGTWTVAPTRQIDVAAADDQPVPVSGRADDDPAPPPPDDDLGNVPPGYYTKVSVIDPLSGPILSSATGIASEIRFAVEWFDAPNLPKVAQLYNVNGYDDKNSFRYFSGKCVEVIQGAGGYIGVFEND